MENKKIAYSVQEAAEAIGLHPNTIRKLIRDGRLPAVHLQRKILISRLELQKWLSNGGTPGVTMEVKNEQ
jgi:excisionase family DNA binding protein